LVTRDTRWSCTYTGRSAWEHSSESHPSRIGARSSLPYQNVRDSCFSVPDSRVTAYGVLPGYLDWVVLFERGIVPGTLSPNGLIPDLASSYGCGTVIAPRMLYTYVACKHFSWFATIPSTGQQNLASGDSAGTQETYHLELGLSRAHISVSSILQKHPSLPLSPLAGH
jgi:hypothetical protein